MKTLLITLEYPPFNGGVSNYYANLVKYWPFNEGIEVLTNRHNKLISNRRFFPWFRAVYALVDKKRHFSFNYVLVGQILPLGIVVWLVSFIIPFKYAVILHGLDFSSTLVLPRKRFITSLILKRADKIICANSKVKEMVVEFNYKLEDKIAIVNPGVEGASVYNNENDIKALKVKHNLNDTFVLFTLGRLTLRKGADFVIKAMSSEEFKSKKIKYFIAGKGKEEKYLKSLASASSASNSIFFLGELSEKEKWNWLNICDIFIMPAREIGPDFEGFGIVYLEANLAKKAVIAGKSGGVADAVVDGENGLLINPNNVVDIRESILRLMDDKDLLQKLGERGRERALKKFNWERQILSLSNFIKQ